MDKFYKGELCFNEALKSDIEIQRPNAAIAMLKMENKNGYLLYPDFKTHLSLQWSRQCGIDQLNTVWSRIGTLSDSFRKVLR